MRLIQFLEKNERRVGISSEHPNDVIALSAASVYELAQEAIRKNTSLESVVNTKRTSRTVGFDQIVLDQRLLVPFDHPDLRRTWVTGTGLTHLDSAKSRDEMHQKLAGDTHALTDSMKMFKIGVDGGKPQAGQVGAQPEWFYKGDGSCVVKSGQALEQPEFALDGGEEAELTGVYLIGDDGTPHRVGFALGNEFSDHVLERQNDLCLAHSKLRACSFGPELLIGDAPSSITGDVRTVRDGTVIYRGNLLTGEANMSHSIANLEHHHFKYAIFRQPGDAHVHMFGASGLSTTAGVQAQHGDVFEIESPTFGRVLRNPLEVSKRFERIVEVKPL